MSTTDLPGSSLLANRYRLVERLGAGGMSVVWRGFDEVLGRQVAVKVLPPSSSADPSFRRRLRAEAQAAARLSHPNITNVYDYGEATTVDGEPVPYVVMELVDGESLAAVLARSRRLPWPAAVRICAEVSAALAAAHARGIVHRDVTPANVMLTPTGAKVVDFGISALIGENDIDPDGSLLGTPAYLAPERLEGGQVSPATDVYAVGLLIYRTLIGQLPWDVGTTTALLRAHQYTEPDPLPPVEGLPANVADLVEQCLEKRPDDRPSSAELAEVLAAASSGVPAGRGYVPDWADSGEDTTILPNPHGYTDGIGVRGAHARVAESPAQAGRGVAAVRAAAEGPAGLAAAAAAVAAAQENAPVSPAPGNAIPVPVADVEAAVHGEPVDSAAPTSAPPSSAPPSSARPSSAPPSSAPPSSAPPSSAPPSSAPPSSAPPAQASATPAQAPAPNRGPGQNPVRNNRFGGSPRSAPVAGAAAGSAGALRPAADGPKESRSSLPGGGTPPPGKGRPPGAGSGAPRPPRSGRTQGRRVLIAAGTVALLGAAMYAWSLAAGDLGRTPSVKGQPQPSVLAGSGKCVVSYAVWTDANKRFKATLTVANRDNQAIKNWNLWFIMQGDQVVSGSGKVDLDQNGRTVTVKGASTLSPQKAVTLDVTGRYTNSNAAPMVFQLGGQTCEAYVSPKPGAPSQPVQQLSNGSLQLGPPVSSKNPPPGVKVGRNGIVVPIPGPTKTQGPPGGTTTDPVEEPTGGVTTAPTVDCDAIPLPQGCPPPEPGPQNQQSSGVATTAPTEEPPDDETPPPSDPADTGTDDTVNNGSGNGNGNNTNGNNTNSSNTNSSNEGSVAPPF